MMNNTEEIIEIDKEEVMENNDQFSFNREDPSKEWIYDNLLKIVSGGEVISISFKSNIEKIQISMFDKKPKDIKEKIKLKEDDNGSFSVIVSSDLDNYHYKVLFHGSYNISFSEGVALSLDINKKEKIKVLFAYKETMKDNIISYKIDKNINGLIDIVYKYFNEKLLRNN